MMENQTRLPSMVKRTSGASFRVFGAGLDLEAVTEKLGLHPDLVHRQGDPDPGKRPYPHDMWSIASPLNEAEELEAHIKWLSDRLTPYKDFISSLRRRFKVDIYCWMTYFTEQAGLALSTETLRFLADMGLDLDVSLIFLPPES